MHILTQAQQKQQSVWMTYGLIVRISRSTSGEKYDLTGMYSLSTCTCLFDQVPSGCFDQLLIITD